MIEILKKKNLYIQNYKKNYFPDNKKKKKICY